MGGSKTGYVKVEFNPQWICEAKAEMIITNTVTAEKFLYSLRGRSYEPLSENHFRFVC